MAYWYYLPFEFGLRVSCVISIHHPACSGRGYQGHEPSLVHDSFITLVAILQSMKVRLAVGNVVVVRGTLKSITAPACSRNPMCMLIAAEGFALARECLACRVCTNQQ